MQIRAESTKRTTGWRGAIAIQFSSLYSELVNLEQSTQKARTLIFQRLWEPEIQENGTKNQKTEIEVHENETLNPTILYSIIRFRFPTIKTLEIPYTLVNRKRPYGVYQTSHAYSKFGKYRLAFPRCSARKHNGTPTELRQTKPD